jgi:hypothetical protein
MKRLENRSTFVTRAERGVGREPTLGSSGVRDDLGLDNTQRIGLSESIEQARNDALSVIQADMHLSCENED